MVVVGTFGPGNAYQGRTVTWDAGVFTIDGVGPTDLDALRHSEAAGQFTWASPETDAWADSVAGETPLAVTSAVIPPGPALVQGAPIPQAPRRPLQFAPKTIAIAAAVLVLIVVGVAVANIPPRIDPDPPRVLENTTGTVSTLPTGHPPVDGTTSTTVGPEVIVVPPEIIVPPKPAYARSAEITANIRGTSLYFPGTNGTGMTLYTTWASFSAKSKGKTVGNRTAEFEVSRSELDAQKVKKTSARSKAVNKLVAQLKSAGWTVTGKGAYWYSVKLSK
jgi:hypothetical protein